MIIADEDQLLGVCWNVSAVGGSGLGPDVHSFVAPTFLVRVSPPACETAHILISSPASSSVAPQKKYVFSGLAKYIIIAPRGMGV